MSTTNILDLNNRIDALEKAVSGRDSAQANKKDIATEFNTTTNYTAGGFVYYKGKLYQFNADHTAGAWDPTDVVEANVTDQIVSNKAAIDGLTASDIGYDNTDSGLNASNVNGAIDEVVERFNYSTTEHIIGEWIDGSPLYEKVIDFGALPNNQDKSVAHGISNINIITDLMGFAIKTPTGTTLALPAPSNNYAVLYANNTIVGITTGGDRSEYNVCYVILHYTKSN